VTEHDNAAGGLSVNSRLSLEAVAIAPGSRVLAIGKTDQYLAGVLAGRGCELVAIGGDADPQPSVAAHYARILAARPAGFDYLGTFGKEAFDVILLADPLTPSPGILKTVRAAQATLRPDGIVLLSAFNSSHGSLRLAGLLGVDVPDLASKPTMTWPAVAAWVAGAGLEIAEATAVIVDPIDGDSHLDASGLPEAVTDWIRGQKGAYEREYVVSAAPPSHRLGAAPVTPKPAIPVPGDAAGESPWSEEPDPLVRIEAIAVAILDSMERRDLRARDAALGAEASAATARRELERLASQFQRRIEAVREDARRREESLRRESRKQAAAEVEAVRRRYERSAAWRIGRLVTAPVRLMKKLARRG
jgi:2-polyprenyl-3-methyl-5-hydroxy-6-metoxy-1,4-benzoquinol methylase